MENILPIDILNDLKNIKRIAVTGGKGGTGKSTVAVLLAGYLAKKGKNVVLVDADVECPNDHLLLGKKLDKPIKAIYNDVPELNKNKCRRCGQCVSVCRSHAITQVPQNYPVFLNDFCTSCGACWASCPNKAINVKQIKIGNIFLNLVKLNIKEKSGNFWLISGVAKVGLEETGPVVREVKKFVSESVKKNKIKIDYILFDTAAGTHCPVITALKDIDLAYAVTEPTPMGAYDLRLILNLLKKIKTKFKIVLNQADLIEENQVGKIFKDLNIKKFNYQIPYSKQLAELYSQGKLLNLNV